MWSLFWGTNGFMKRGSAFVVQSGQRGPAKQKRHEMEGGVRLVHVLQHKLETNNTIGKLKNGQT